MKTTEVTAIQKEFSRSNEVVQTLCKEIALLNSVVERMANDLIDLERENKSLKETLRKELSPPAPPDDEPIIQGVLLADEDTEPVGATMVYGRLVKE